MAEQLDEVYSLLIPFAGGKLILPRVSVAEVTGFLRPKPVRGAPDWLLGLINWQNQEIPLVSFEGMCGRKVPERAGRTRIAVTHAIGEQINPPVVALLTQGYPYLVRVNPAVLSVDPENDFGTGPVLNRVRMANERPVIPDLEAIEERLLEVMPERRFTDTSTGTGSATEIPLPPA
ncbi:MAG TPA: chemotaxis protein CheW [Gammaproteobacteria bacterium]|nr:chemotaxis protein CheW [Gammaproteobacteria bacterium]